MRYTIQVPKPCHEEWNDMTPTDGGRHCTQCSKTVIDFTSWQQEDILAYLQQNSAAGVCGRLRREQVNVPITSEQFISSVTWSPMPLYQKIAAIFLFAFGLIQMSYSADAQTKQPQHHTQTHTPQTQHPTMGKSVYVPHKTDTTNHKPVKKTNKQHSVTGFVAPTVVPEVDPGNHHVAGGLTYTPVPEEQHLQGDVQTKITSDSTARPKTKKR